MKTSFFSTPKFLLLLSLAGIMLSLGALISLSPRPYQIEVIHPDLKVSTNAGATVFHRKLEDGPFWIKFKTPERPWAPATLKLRTRGCVNDLSLNSKEWVLPSSPETRCENTKGFLLRTPRSLLSQTAEWNFAGLSQNGSFGVILDLDWMDPLPLLGLFCLLVCLGWAVTLTVSTENIWEKSFVAAILSAAFLLRFYFVFIVSPPDLTLFSDMGAYFQRASEISEGVFRINQLFQPIGFTLWSLVLRYLGGFTIFSWSQVFFSWLTVLLIYLIAQQQGGRFASLVALVFAAFHIPLAAFSALHLAEGVYAFLITAFLWLAAKMFHQKSLLSYLLSGFLLTLAFYFKGNHAFFILFFLAWIFLRDFSWQENFKKIAFFSLGASFWVGLHLLGTSDFYGKAQWGPTAGALNFVEGKCPSKDNVDSLGNRWMSPLFVITGENTFKKWPRPFTDQAYFWREGIKCIEENPQVLLTSFRYIYYLFAGNALWPIFKTSLHPWYEVWEPFFYFIILPFSLLGGVFAFRQRQPWHVMSLLMVLSLFLTVWFFKSENRFRVPFDAIFLVWSSFGISWVYEMLKSSRLDKYFGELMLWVREENTETKEDLS